MAEQSPEYLIIECPHVINAPFGLIEMVIPLERNGADLRLCWNCAAAVQKAVLDDLRKLQVKVR